MKKATKKLFKAKDLCRRKFPYLSALVYGMPCTPCEQVETMGVDAQGRCYYSEKFVEGLPVEQVAYVLLHETFHLALSHHKRRAAWCDSPTDRDYTIWNIAADMCIQTALEADAGDWEPDFIVTWEKYRKVPGIVHGLTTERYADLLRAGIPEDQTPENPETGGSCADGNPRPGERPGTGAASLEGKLAKVADEIAKIEKTKPGSTPGCLRRAIDRRLGRVRDWTVVLREIVSRSVASPIGEDEFTYRKMSRRQSPGVARRPGVIRLSPECTIVVDTSGSMEDCVGPACAAVASGLRKVHRPRVVCWDADLQSDKRLVSMAGFSWDGGGGTSMDDAIQFADKQKTDCIVCITDGETDWPRKRTRARLVIAIVRECSYPTPSWARVVQCWEGTGYEG